MQLTDLITPEELMLQVARFREGTPEAKKESEERHLVEREYVVAYAEAVRFVCSHFTDEEVRTLAFAAVMTVLQNMDRVVRERGEH